MTGDLALLVDYIGQYPDEVARRADQQGADDAVALLQAVPGDVGATLLGRMAPVTAVHCLELAPAERAVEWLETVPVDTAAALLRRLAPDAAAAFMAELPSARRQTLQLLLTYGPETAGAVMDPLVLVVPEASSVTEARALVEAHPDRLYYYLYVVDADHRLCGAFDVPELMRAAADARVRDILTPHVTWIPAESTLETVFAHPGWRDLDALPVVDAGQRFLGIIRHRRMRQLRALRGEADEAANGVRAVMALGELCWLGLCGLVQGFGSAAAAPGAAEGGDQ